MFATIRDDTWNALNMPHIIPNLKRWDYSDINRIKDPPTWLKVATILEKPPTPTHPTTTRKTDNCKMRIYIWIYLAWIILFLIHVINMAWEKLIWKAWIFLVGPFKTMCAHNGKFPQCKTFLLYSWYCGYWFPGKGRSQGISRHCNNICLKENYSLSTSGFELLLFFY